MKLSRQLFDKYFQLNCIVNTIQAYMTIGLMCLLFMGGVIIQLSGMEYNYDIAYLLLLFGTMALMLLYWNYLFTELFLRRIALKDIEVIEWPKQERIILGVKV